MRFSCPGTAIGKTPAADLARKRMNRGEAPKRLAHRSYPCRVVHRARARGNGRIADAGEACGAIQAIAQSPEVPYRCNTAGGEVANPLRKRGRTGLRSVVRSR